MDAAFYYPVNEFGPLMKGAVIGGLGIFHVFTAQFAIGGGFLLCYFQWLSMTGRSAVTRRFLDDYFKFLVLVSFVAGALTGVGMWFTSIQVSPATIGVMVDEFHWLWAVEWTFFSLEVVAGYGFYRYGRGLNDRARMTLLALYTFAAWMSLFWINGILSFQLTPGAWVESRNIWDGFFNPSFFPQLLYRTVAALVVASLVAMAVVNAIPTFTREEKEELVHRAAWLLTPMALMPVLGVWFLAVLPADSREWALGGSAAMNLFLNIAVGSSMLIGLYAFVGLIRQKLFINGATATLLAALAFGATAGGEFVREGVRKPYTLRQVMYSNAVRPEQVAELRKVGLTTHDPFPLRGAAALPAVDGKPHPRLLTGALVFRSQCGICHTESGMNGLLGLTGGWDADMMRQNFAKLQKLKPFMPPFAGTPEELEGQVQYLEWKRAGKPATWPDSLADAATRDRRLTQIRTYLDEAGAEPAIKRGPKTAAAAGRVEGGE